MTTTTEKLLAFRVGEQALFTGTRRVDTHKALVRTDTQQLLGVVGTDYTYVQNEDLLRPFYDALKRAGLGSMTVHPRLYNNGAWWRCDFITPKLKAEPVVGDIVQFRASVINSFDGSSKVQVMYGAQRLVCLNGMTAAIKDYGASRKHTKGLPAFDFTANVQEAVDQFTNNARHWREWERTLIPWREGVYLLTQLVGERVVTHMNHPLSACSLWDIYNHATAWASHENLQPVRMRTDRGPARALHQRELDVMAWAKRWPALREEFAKL